MRPAIHTHARAPKQQQQQCPAPHTHSPPYHVVVKGRQQRLKHVRQALSLTPQVAVALDEGDEQVIKRAVEQVGQDGLTRRLGHHGLVQPVQLAHQGPHILVAGGQDAQVRQRRLGLPLLQHGLQLDLDGLGKDALQELLHHHPVVGEDLGDGAPLALDDGADVGEEGADGVVGHQVPGCGAGGGALGRGGGRSPMPGLLVATLLLLLLLLPLLGRPGLLLAGEALDEEFVLVDVHLGAGEAAIELQQGRGKVLWWLERGGGCVG